MKAIRYTFLSSLVFWLFLFGCAKPEVQPPVPETVSRAFARIVERNLIECFDEGLETAQSKLVQCETSAVVYTGHEMIFGSDKPIPGDSRSAVFSLQYSEQGLVSDSRTYLTDLAFVTAIKYEDFTVTPDGKYIIATTGFDRVKPDSSTWNAYNTLLIWPVEHSDAVKIVSPSTVDGVTSSVALRQKLSYALRTHRYPERMPYFKVEGLAAIPGNRLLFGIREVGEKYDEFDYTIMIVAASYIVENGDLILADDFRLIYDYNPVTRSELTHPVALSSIEYDRYADRLYLLTSFEESETDEGLGGFLWTLPITDLNAGNAPTLVMKNVSEPLLFAHKAEGLSVLDAYRVFVIHDDDRVLGRERVENPETQFSRKPNQAAYTIVEFTD